jgi:adenine-specific DNA-methyltransferase
MPRGKKTIKIETTAESYDHKQETTLRPDIGLQAQFKQKRDPKKYRYDSSLSPELSWDINAERERAEAMIAKIREAKTLEEAKSAASTLAHLSKPFLNWTGKTERAEFTVPTLPLFVHERLSTKAILESLKRRKRDKTQQMTLFGDVELDLTDRILRAYEHKAPWVNRMILGDSLVVMNSQLEYEGLGGQVQMIYMDPPYGVKFGSNFQPFIRKRDVKHGDDQFMTREPEMVQAYRDTWELGIHSYLTYLRDRFLIARELLTESGSIFVQISDENVHHVRELMDEIFGTRNFVSQIAFQRSSGFETKYLPGLYPQFKDIILNFFSKFSVFD